MNFYSALDNKTTFIRLVIFILIMLSIIFGGLHLFLFNPKSNLTITITETGATVIKIKNQTVTAQFLLPASARWTNTGISFEPKSVVEITASGMVHLGLKSLYVAADTDRKPDWAWCTPKGLDFTSSRPRDVSRRNFLITPEAPVGAIIGYFQKDGDPEPGMQNQRPQNLITIYERTEITYPDYHAKLWLIINDVMLDPRRIEESKNAYFGPMEALTPLKRVEKDSSWSYIVSKSYWDIWYDDNLGNYLVQLRAIN